MSHSLQPMDCSLPGSSMEFSRQEYWSELLFPAPGDLPDHGCTARCVFFFFLFWQILTDLLILPEGQDLQEVHSHGKRDNKWDDLGEWHWNTYNIIYGTSHQSRFDAWYWMLGAGALGRPRGMVWGWRREEGSGWGTHVYLWQIHFDIWQNQYNTVQFKNKIKLK